MKGRTAIAVFTLLALFALIQAGMRGSKESRAYETAEIVVNNRVVSVLLADTELKRIRGLSGRKTIGADGMLFVFPREDFHGIWMKEMVFPIDIMWLKDITPLNPPSKEGGRKRGGVAVVVDIKENVAPDTFPEVFYPKERAVYVLEAMSGFARDTAVSIGDRVSVRFSKFKSDTTGR